MAKERDWKAINADIRKQGEKLFNIVAEATEKLKGEMEADLELLRSADNDNLDPFAETPPVPEAEQPDIRLLRRFMKVSRIIANYPRPDTAKLGELFK